VDFCCSMQELVIKQAAAISPTHTGTSSVAAMKPVPVICLTLFLTVWGAEQTGQPTRDARSVWDWLGLGSRASNIGSDIVVHRVVVADHPDRFRPAICTSLRCQTQQVTCDSSQECNSGYECASGVCVAKPAGTFCNGAIPCSTGQVCLHHRCITLQSHCFDHSECDAGFWCSRFICTRQSFIGDRCDRNVECLTDVCVGGRCVECTAERQFECCDKIDEFCGSDNFCVSFIELLRGLGLQQ